ncbi:hypothetical protein BO71DRAFT_424162 [Aspergillus ellipticus CBS 707.79]|uniref:Zn(2)-C6 fungal-type domain-containing protein n=1 Tax=Aspergillus ellipticus CBS 707.79 TaxID=1448320 RepID=A0A319CTD6_9EURO|nr:hypothetical protein BO71DRAFT_424162 [Aspergillus ellipticus CBS 707.79]
MSSAGPSKRRRVGKACDSCRRRKSKCDGAQPICGICRSAELPCSYQPPRRRGLQMGYVRSVEVALGIFLHEMPSLEDTLRRVLRDSREDKRPQSGELAALWRKSKLAKDISRMLNSDSAQDTEDSELDDILGLEGKGEERAADEAAGDEGARDEVAGQEGAGKEVAREDADSRDDQEDLVDMNNEHLRRIPTQSPPPPPRPIPSPPIPPLLPSSQAHKPRIPPYFTLPPLHQPPLEPAKRISFLDVPYPEDIDATLDAYFAHIHSWLPILERGDILRVRHSPRDAIPPEDASCRLVIWAAVALVSTMSVELRYPRFSDPMKLQHKVQQQITKELDNLDLGHVQALLILVLLHIGRGHLHLAWPLVGQAYRMLVMLREPLKVGRYQHVMHGCILLDNLTSSILDKSPCTSADDQIFCEPVNMKDVQEWEMWTIPPPNKLPDKGPASRGPLRSLSTLNRISGLMRRFAPLLTQQHHLVNWHSATLDLQAYQSLYEDRYAEIDIDNAEPAILTLHLTGAFVVMAFFAKNGLFTPRAVEVCMENADNTLELLGTYNELTDRWVACPLFRCFLFQAHRCLHTTLKRVRHPKMMALREKVDEYHMAMSLDHTKYEGMSQNTIFTFQTPVPRVKPSQRAAQPAPQPAPQPSPLAVSGHPNAAYNPLNNPQLHTPMRMGQPAATTGLSMSNSTTSLNAPDQSGQRTEDFDALFDEMVASMPPVRNEPAFAENLGFHAGNMDPEFLAQIAQIQRLRHTW